jgi:rhodanese-related sulfurtransferase
LSIIGDLAAAFAGQSERQQRKAFAIQKGVNIATTTMDTFLSAQKAYASQVAIVTPDAPVRASIAAGIAIAQGLARVAIISKQQFNGSGGTSGGASGGSIPAAGGDGTTAPSPANFDFLQNQPNQQPPLQAYVVGTQVSSNLEAQQLIQNQSRLGG